MGENGHAVGYYWHCGDGWGDFDAFMWIGSEAKEMDADSRAGT